MTFEPTFERCFVFFEFVRVTCSKRRGRLALRDGVYTPSCSQADIVFVVSFVLYFLFVLIITLYSRVIPVVLIICTFVATFFHTSTSPNLRNQIRDLFLKNHPGNAEFECQGARIEVWVSVWGSAPSPEFFFDFWILNGRILMQTVPFVQFT